MNVLKELKEKGHILSMPRIAILRYLLEHKTHHTAESIHKALEQEYPNLSLATVYNTLKLLSREGFIRQLHISENRTLYDSNTKPHSHFLCRICGKIEDIWENEKTNFPKEINGNLIEDVHTYYFGICRECRKKYEKGQSH